VYCCSTRRARHKRDAALDPERYGAEVVTLTVNLGQPGEDYAVIEASAQIGAVECHVVDAREEFASEYLAPAIKANALYAAATRSSPRWADR